MRLPDPIFGDIAFENVLSIKVLVLLLILAGWSMWDRYKWEDRES